MSEVVLQLTLDEAKTLAGALRASFSEGLDYDALVAHELNRMISALDPEWEPEYVPEHNPAALWWVYLPRPAGRTEPEPAA